MATPNLYRGYSSFEFQESKTFAMRDVALTNLDLLNHIFTRRGERVMMPTFGTSVSDIAFEQLDEDTLDELRDELTDVFLYDPRVELISMNLVPRYDSNLVLVECILRYIELNVTEDFELNIQFEDS